MSSDNSPAPAKRSRSDSLDMCMLFGGIADGNGDLCSFQKVSASAAPPALVAATSAARHPAYSLDLLALNGAKG